MWLGELGFPAFFKATALALTRQNSMIPVPGAPSPALDLTGKGREGGRRRTPDPSWPHSQRGARGSQTQELRRTGHTGREEGRPYRPRLRTPAERVTVPL